MPFTTVLQQTYDSGDFVKNLDDCLALADYGGVAERRAAAKKRGKLLGIGRRDGGRRHRRARLRACRNPLRPVGRRRADDRQHGSRPGSRHDLQAGPVGKARHRCRSDPLPLWRQRPGDDGHRHLRLALGAARRLGDRRRRRPADRQGPQDRRPYDGGGASTTSSSRTAASRSPAPTARSASPRSRSTPSMLRISAERYRDRLLRAGQFRSGRLGDLSQRRASLRGRDRRRDRRGRA